MAPGRTDRASRFIAASRPALYRAIVDPTALIKWLPPEGMTGEVERFEPRTGGAYRIVLTYTDPQGAPGKSSDNSDVVEGRFVELVENRKVVQEGVFESDDDAFAGVMLLTWSLEDADGGTTVTVTAENVPPGISKEDHDAGLRSTLDNLAAYIA